MWHIIAGSALLELLYSRKLMVGRVTLVASVKDSIRLAELLFSLEWLFP